MAPDFAFMTRAMEDPAYTSDLSYMLLSSGEPSTAEVLPRLKADFGLAAGAFCDPGAFADCGTSYEICLEIASHDDCDA